MAGIQARSIALLAVVLAVTACPDTRPALPAEADASEPSTVPDGGSDAGDSKCVPCLVGTDCSAGSTCLQYAADNYCAKLCSGPSDCAPTETCLVATSLAGAQVSACVPAGGACHGPGCGTCNPGFVCDTSAGTCVPSPADGGTLPSNRCGTLLGPTETACCHSCSGGNCQTNGCYGGWWCDTVTCRCHAPPTSCGTPDAGTDAGTVVVEPDGGLPPPTGSVDIHGGTVSRLYFAVIGDTRPANIDDTAGYPSAIVNKVFEDTQAMNPRPQFMVATGDYIFASPNGTEGAPQLALYAQAAQRFSGPLFPVVGNHECTGYTAGNCATQGTKNLTAYMQTLVAPLGQSAPYYSIPFKATDGSWTAKLVVAACNVWDAGQSSWLSSELAKPTTYTFVARHEPSSATNAPCVREVDTILGRSSYNLLLVGHTHTFSHSGKEIIVGIGGAPLSFGSNYGFATVEQIGAGFRVTQYDYTSMAPVSSFVVPY